MNGIDRSIVQTKATGCVLVVVVVRCIEQINHLTIEVIFRLFLIPLTISTSTLCANSLLFLGVGLCVFE